MAIQKLKKKRTLTKKRTTTKNKSKKTKSSMEEIISLYTNELVLSSTMMISKQINKEQNLLKDTNDCCRNRRNHVAPEITIRPTSQRDGNPVRSIRVTVRIRHPCGIRMVEVYPMELWVDRQGVEHFSGLLEPGINPPTTLVRSISNVTNTANTGIAQVRFPIAAIQGITHYRIIAYSRCYPNAPELDHISEPRSI